MSGLVIPVIIIESREATSTDAFTIKSTRQSDGSSIRVKTVSVQNVNSNSKTVDIGFYTGGYAVYLETLTLTTAGQTYISRLDVLIPASYQIIVRVNSPTSGDLYYINIMAERETE
jgi:hypothetical protein